jgi:hypothetical protein
MKVGMLKSSRFTPTRDAEFLVKLVKVTFRSPRLLIAPPF